MRKYLPLAIVFFILAANACKKETVAVIPPTSPTPVITQDPVDTIIGIYYGIQHYIQTSDYNYNNIHHTDTIIDTNYLSPITIRKVGTDSFSVIGYYSFSPWDYNYFSYILYDGNYYSHGSGSLTFFPDNDSIHIASSYEDGVHYLEKYKYSFEGKKIDSKPLFLHSDR